jgi:hypothetical protein
VAEIAEQTVVRRASIQDATDSSALPLLTDISVAQWRTLAARAVEPNGYYQPDWELAVNASAHGRTGAAALSASGDAAGLIGLLPVIPMSRAYKIPLPALVGADPTTHVA